MMYDVLNDYFNECVNEFIAHNHIWLYLMRKNIAIISFIFTCKLNKDYVYYKKNTLNHELEESLVYSDFFYILKYILKYSVNLSLSNHL